MTTLQLPVDGPWADGAAVAAVLRTAGHQAWYVGGCVRDALLGRAVADVDIATDAHPEQVERIFPDAIGVGRSFGVMVVPCGPGRSVEVATFRNDGVYVDGRRPTGIVFTTAEDDVRRRDFTINALLCDPIDGRVVDHVGGVDDLQRRILRTVGDPLQRLGEDRLRVLRGLRFAAHLGLAIDPPTWDAFCRIPVSGLSPERLWQEWEKSLKKPGRSQWWSLMRRSGRAADVLPWPTAGDGLDAVLEDDHPLLASALLLMPTPASELTSWLERQPIPRDMVRTLCWAQSSITELVAGCPLARQRRLLRHTDAALIAGFFRCTGQRSDLVAATLAEQGVDHRPWLSAKDLLDMGLRPGPGLGRILKDVEDAQLDGRISDREAALDLARRLSGS